MHQRVEFVSKLIQRRMRVEFGISVRQQRYEFRNKTFVNEAVLEQSKDRAGMPDRSGAHDASRSARKQAKNESMTEAIKIVVTGNAQIQQQWIASQPDMTDPGMLDEQRKH